MNGFDITSGFLFFDGLVVIVFVVIRFETAELSLGLDGFLRLRSGQAPTRPYMVRASTLDRCQAIQVFDVGANGAVNSLHIRIG